MFNPRQVRLQGVLGLLGVLSGEGSVHTVHAEGTRLEFITIEGYV